MKIITVLLLSLFCLTLTAQVETEVPPPFNIKTASFIQNSKNTIPIFKLGDGFDFQFDDLFGNEADYYYEITHCDYNWIPSDIPKSDYLQGFDSQKILDYANSFNTLQTYSHYNLTIPNQYTRLLLSGNYVLTILNSDKEVVLKRHFILYEDLVKVPLKIKKARTVSNLYTKHNLEFEIIGENFLFQNPTQNLKVVLLQNGKFNSALKNIPSQYVIGNTFVYKYDKETQFWAGNEFLNFDSKDIRYANNYISYVNSDNDIYNTHLYTNEDRTNLPYTNLTDINGNFKEQIVNGQNPKIEADYSWVYFTLSAPSFMLNKNVYVGGMFNNYSTSPEYKMDYNAKTALYEKAILIKQGFVNYQYHIADNKGIMDQENGIDGNFYQTVNDYSVLVYYKGNGDRYEKVIGYGTANSLQLTN
ncbi:DUF5103 domain-containing protein [Flavobacterium sp. ZT3R18]|uniref:type IX secretion system plug protein n=1 Tax=Flavobacterium sp. ZT3R18 TaxID=2594429 RepID=UPI00117B38A7|nr:DUF5103 domain-containing protein [Flavobacterium sp. ZT3R18]TRX38735.1 DUF5103 domain-containing protein [Flavobacterium sp. ZT3R18]